MKHFTHWIISITILCFSLSSSATTLYVDLNSPTDGPGTAWSNAFQTIQGGIDAAFGSIKTVLVADGIYDTGSEAASGMNLQNRVFIDKSLLTVKSVHGPEVTIIKGAGPNGPNAVRCVFIGPDSTLSGFTLTGGHTRTNNYSDQIGGGIYCYSNSVIENCILTDNSADKNGGAGYLGIFNQCKISNNHASNTGGGIYKSVLNNCTISGNYGPSAGGARDSTLNNCIIWDNIEHVNANGEGDNWFNCTINYCCTTPMPTNGTGNITSDPQFISSNDLHLAISSLCIDSGNNAYTQGATDLEGDERIYDSNRDGIATVDMGCYETIIKNTWYVKFNSPIDGPGTSWNNAFHNIQAAISSAVDNDTVFVTNGVYSSSGITIHDSLGSRVGINKAITVKSINGPEVTIIKGYGGGDGSDARRCAYVGTNAVLSGFTLTNGHTRITGTPQTERSGGGVWCEASGIVSNCIIVGNTANESGGGAYHGTFSRCIIRGNAATIGGGSYYGTFNNCLINSNSASADGGGCYNGIFNNCTIAKNNAVGDGGGVYNATINNSIIWSNTASSYSNWIGGTFTYCCTAPLPSGTDNISDDPEFGAFGASSFQPSPFSTCTDSGNNAVVNGEYDLTGIPRILASDKNAAAIVDRGCYEDFYPEADSDGDGMPDGWERDNGLNYVDFSDMNENADADPASNYEEYVALTSPTNSASYFKITSISNHPQATVYFESTGFRVYTLQSCSNLLNNTWTDVPGAGPLKGCCLSLSDTNQPAKGPYYRVKVQIP